MRSLRVVALLASLALVASLALFRYLAASRPLASELTAESSASSSAESNPDSTVGSPAGRAPNLPPEIAAVLVGIKVEDRDQLAVSEEDGRFLRLMAATSGAKHALEIGSAFGYSAIWIGLGLRQTAGHLTTVEFDAGRARQARENIRRAGLATTVDVVAGDAFKEIPRLPGDFDFVFLDAWKRDYRRFFDLVLPLMKPHGLFLAHNVVNKRTEMGDFLDAIQTNPAVLTAIVAPSSEGMSVSYKVQ